MMKQWEEENFSKFGKDFTGRLLAMAGLLIALIAAPFTGGTGVVFGLALFMIGRAIMSRAAYKPTQRTQDALESGASIIEKITQWF
jgi:hypothetical protein